MQQLWAPWRIRYIKQAKQDGCFLCRKSQQADDAVNHILIRDRTCFALLNTYPYNPGHMMIAPYKHTGDLADLAEQELTELILLTRRCQQLLRAVLNPDGFNIGMNFGRVAGAGLEDHLHLHIVPRWNGDTNFMPVLGDVRVIPQALDELYAELRKHL
ncbi:MAG: HIT domain-containing protein [Verrucomicrobiae bacterium]|nr:HIT domain-containing protein [Verrucomicrobiae bacterium]